MQEQGAIAEAKECFQRVIRSLPELADAHNNLGSLHNAEHNLTEAIRCYDRALELRPDFAAALNNLGNVLRTQGRGAEAAVCYEQTLRITPDDAQARQLVARAIGRWRSGWRLARVRVSLGLPRLSQAHVQPAVLAGRTARGAVLLVHAEQGLGDTIQFVRYLPRVAECGGRVIFEVPQALIPLLERSGVGRHAALVATGSALPKFDVQVPLLSLPGVFGTTLETIPADVPYLAASPRLVEHWRMKLAGPALKVGICWQGNTSHPGDYFRSMPLARFAPLAQPDVELISLQRGTGSEQLADERGSFSVRELGDEVDREHGPFMDTAAIVQCLDVVVAADTAIAHLAGALGAKVWMALTVGPDWRWMYDRADSPWYPTMRLFRQRRLGDLDDVFESIAMALRALVGQRRRGGRRENE